MISEDDYCYPPFGPTRLVLRVLPSGRLTFQLASLFEEGYLATR